MTCPTPNTSSVSGRPSWTAGGPRPGCRRPIRSWRKGRDRRAGPSWFRWNRWPPRRPLWPTSGSRCDPGPRPTLALGLAQVMVSKGWYSRDAVQARATGLEDLKAFLEGRYTPQRVAKMTGLTPGRDRKAGQGFRLGQTGGGLKRHGKGEMPVSLLEAAAVQILNVLVGAVNRTGGVMPRAEGGLRAIGPKRPWTG